MYLGQPSPPRISLANLPEGAQGTRTTLQIMSAYVKQFKANARVRNLALSIVEHLAPKDWAGEVRVMHEWVRDQIRYVADIHGVETVQTPLATLDIGQGDCDDMSSLLASLLEAIGHPSRFFAIGDAPGTFKHVLVQTPVGGRWIGLDPTQNVPAGWMPSGYTSVMVQNN
jgi:transglutaminase-like putative cysteine protease